MGKRYTTPSKKSKYYIPKEDFLTAVHYALRYPLWIQELNDMANTSKAITYDKDRVQSSNDYDSTFEAAVRISESEMRQKTKLIDDIIAQVACGMDSYLRLGVCYGLTFDQLKGKGLPCERDMYYNIRRHFYYELSQQI
jgi:hypothetical protein